MGAWCVELALSVGIFPYVLKLLQTTLPGLRASLVFIWCKILAADRNCQTVCSPLSCFDALCSIVVTDRASCVPRDGHMPFF